MRLLIYFPTDLNSSAWEAVTPPTTMTLVWPPSENLMQAWFILATPILVRVQYSTVQYSTVQYLVRVFPLSWEVLLVELIQVSVLNL